MTQIATKGTRAEDLPAHPTPQSTGLKNVTCLLLGIAATTLVLQAKAESPIENATEALRMEILQNSRGKWDKMAAEPQPAAPKTPQFVRNVDPIQPERSEEFQIYAAQIQQNISALQKSVQVAEIPRKKILARVTTYWAEGGDTDPWSAKNQSSTQTPLVCLHHAAVDPKVIPYGSTILIQFGTGRIAVKAVDTGGAVKSRKAARKLGLTPQEQNAPVVDVFFQKKEDAIQYNENNCPYQWVEVIYPPQIR